MQGKDTTKTTLNQLFEELSDQELLKKLHKELGVDKYVKKLKVDKLLPLIALAQLRQYKGLREISSCLNDKEISKAMNLDSIHASTISRRLAGLPTEALETLFLCLRNECIVQIGLKATAEVLLGRLHLIDSSTISLCVTKYRWAEFRKTKAGVKVHLRLKIHDDGVIPDKMVMTPAKPADRTQMEAMVVVEDKDAINVFDRGYLDYKQFDHYCKNQILFVTRLKENAIVEVMTELDANDLIKRDSIVFVGKGQKRMKHPLRLIETEDTEGNSIRILTNVTDLTATELADVYRYRWRIELFFKWIKQHLKVKHFFGTSDQAVENQLYIALITFCVLTKLKKDSGYTGSLLELTRMLLACLHSSVEDFLAKLLRKPSRSSRGRRILNHDLIFEHTYEQVMAEDIDFLYDSTYDPIIL